MKKHRSRRVCGVAGAVAAFAVVAVAAGPATTADAKAKVGLVQDINPGAASSMPEAFGATATANGTLFFFADDGQHGEELWRSDRNGPALVHDENLGSCPKSPTVVETCDLVAPYTPLIPMGNKVFFPGNDGQLSSELWTSDGTTEQVLQIGYFGNARPHNLTAVGATMFFYANDGVHGDELWKTDGTQSGTMLVKDVNPGQVPSDDSYDPFLTNVNGTLFFGATDGQHGHELWKSDGTAAGTVMVTDINLIPDGTVSLSGSSNPGSLANVNGTLFFAADDGVHGGELWKSDGTAAGTVMVKDIQTALRTGSWPNHITDVNGTAYFEADDGGHGYELWKSDGTAAGTAMVKDINPGTVHSFPALLTNVGGRVFFVADDGLHGTELWTSDGTDAGTRMVKDIYPGNASGYYPSQLTNVNGMLFFAATDGLTGRELWTSDGTQARTVEYTDINPGASDSNPTAFSVLNGDLYFAADDGVSGRELWKTRLRN